MTKSIHFPSNTKGGIGNTKLSKDINTYYCNWRPTYRHENVLKCFRFEFAMRVLN
jgi:hypothetical protein